MGKGSTRAYLLKRPWTLVIGQILIFIGKIFIYWSNFYIYWSNLYVFWSNFYILVKFIYIVVKFLYIVVKFYIYLRLSYFRKLSETIYSLQVHSRLRKGHTYANLMVWLFHLVAPLDWFLQKNDRKNLFGCILDNFFSQ